MLPCYSYVFSFLFLPEREENRGLNQKQSALEVDAQYILRVRERERESFFFRFVQGTDGFEASVDSLAFFRTRS